MSSTDDQFDSRPAPAAAIVLAGGAGRRLGGVDKPGLVVGGVTLLDRALAAVDGLPTIVVGRARPTARPVRFVVEDPPGSGPAAAVAAGISVLPRLPSSGFVVLLAADLPAVSPDTVDRLLRALSQSLPEVEGVAVVDGDGREQVLLSVWRRDPLRAAGAARSSWTAAPLRSLLAPLRRVTIRADADEAADIDTPEQWRRWSGPAVEPVDRTGVSDPSRTVGRSSAGPDHDEERCR